MAVIESPGIPKTSAGIQAPASAALFAAPASMIPSMWPVPNFSGVFENRLEMPYEIHAAMSAPAPAQPRDRVSAQQPALAPPDSADARRRRLERAIDRGGVAHHLRDGEHADHHRDQLHTAHQLDASEGEAWIRRGVLEADGRHQQADRERDERLERPARRDEHRGAEPQEHEPEIFERAEFERNRRERGRRDREHGRAEQAPNGGEHQPRAERGFSVAFPRHRVRLIAVGRGGGRSGNPEQRAGNIAGKNRHGRRRHHARDRRQRWEEERDRHQQRHRHRRREPGDRSDEQPEDRRRQHGAEHQRIEHLAERGDEVLYQAMPSSMPQGSGTRSSV
jgi:hypothetical protein